MRRFKGKTHLPTRDEMRLSRDFIGTITRFSTLRSKGEIAFNTRRESNPPSKKATSEYSLKTPLANRRNVKK